MVNPQILCLIAGVLAGVARSFLGWLESNEDFSKRMFMTTLLRTMILSAMVGYGANQGPIVTFFAVYAGDSALNKSYKISNGAKK